MPPVVRILIVVLIVAACGLDRPAPPVDAPDALGPLRLGMGEDSLRAAMRDAGIDTYCAMSRTALRFCERQDTGDPLQVAYGTVSGRATYLMRQVRARWVADDVEALVARYESRFGPASPATEDLAWNVSVFRYWYPRSGPYRALLCRDRGTDAPGCMELVLDGSPRSVGALMMSRVMERWDTGRSNDACRTWNTVISGSCSPSAYSVVDAPLHADHVLRIARSTNAPPAPPSGAELLLDTHSGLYHYRIWQLRDGNLHGLVCWNEAEDHKCLQVLARYQPEAFLTAFAVTSR